MSAASRERQRQKHLSHLRRGYATWEEFRCWQRAAAAEWLKNDNPTRTLSAPRRVLMYGERATGYWYPKDGEDIYLDEVPVLCDPKIYE